MKKDFGKIKEEYNNFMIPSYEILIDGKKITDKDFSITNIRINLSAKEKAGMANFSVSNCYSSIEKGFSSKVKSTLKLGSMVKISFGYSNKNKELFLGYIVSISYEFDDIPKINVNCLDVMGLLMKNIVEERKPKGEKLEQIINEVLKKYSKFITSTKIDTLQPIDKNKEIVQSGDDYNFVKKIAEENDCDFFAVGEKVYVSNLKNRKKVAATLFYGENVMNFSREFQLKKVEVTAYGKNDNSNETISESYIYETEYPYAIKGEQVSEKKVIRSPKIDSIDKAKKIAINEAKKLIGSSYSSSIQCIGIPELIPGRYVELKDFDKDIDGSFYITDANHNFSPGNYTVSLNISNSE